MDELLSSLSMNLIQQLAVATLFLTSLSTSTIQQIANAPVVQAEMEIATTTPPALKTTRVFEAIAKCESQNNPLIKNKFSTASGRFQFLWGTWYNRGRELWGKEFYEKNIWDYDDNTELAWYVYTKYGTGDWNESKTCWVKLSVDG